MTTSMIFCGMLPRLLASEGSRHDGSSENSSSPRVLIIYNFCWVFCCGSWTMTQDRRRRSRAAERKMLRKVLCAPRRMARGDDVLGVDGREESWHEWLQRTAGSLDAEVKKGAVADWVVEQGRQKWRWAGHVARRRDGRWTSRMLHWLPHGGERSRGRPATRWEDELEVFFKTRGMRWEDCAQDRGAWGQLEQIFVEAVR